MASGHLVPTISGLMYTPPTLHLDIFIAVIKIVMVLAAAISRIGAKRFMNSNRHFAPEVHERE